MSGRCYGCATSFSFFKKELGCKNCGYAFCKDCLKKRTAIPKRKNEVHKVCNRCYDILTGKVAPSAERERSPPEAYKKRVAALNDPKPTHGHGGGHGGTKSKPGTKKYPPNMKKEDIEIAERLEKLKEGRKVEIPSQCDIESRINKLKEPIKPVPTEAEMRDRIDKLNAQPPSNSAQQDNSANVAAGPSPSTAGPTTTCTNPSPNVIPTTGKPMQQDEVHRLMGQYNELVNIDKKYTPQDEGEYTSLPSGQSKPGAYDEQAEIRRLIEQSSGEVKLGNERAAVSDSKDAELRARLHKLKGTSQERKPDVKQDGEEEEESEEAAAEKVLKQILGSSNIKEGVAADVSEESAAEQLVAELEGAPESDPEDQLPWCCMCNNDATLRCYGCDGDLYCNRCYKEGHDRQDYADHKTRKFKPSTGSPDTSP